MNALLPLPRPIESRPLAARSDGTPATTVAFDLDGTLVDTAPDLSAALDHCLASAGLPPMPFAGLRPLAGRGARAMLAGGYAHAGRTASDSELTEQTERFLAHYAAHVADRSRPYPGAVAALDRLAGAGARLAVCTNKTEALARLLLETLGLAGRFLAICGADTFAERKPHPAHLSGTVATAGGDLARTVLVGDTDTDMEAARRLGVPGVLMLFGYDADADARAKAAVCLRHFDELTPDLLAAPPLSPADFRAAPIDGRALLAL